MKRNKNETNSITSYFQFVKCVNIEEDQHYILLLFFPLEITCSDLDDPKYGIVKVSGNTPGARADYKCNGGFRLEGVAWRKCQENGQWSGEAPVCESKSVKKLHLGESNFTD